MHTKEKENIKSKSRKMIDKGATSSNYHHKYKRYKRSIQNSMEDKNVDKKRMRKKEWEKKKEDSWENNFVKLCSIIQKWQKGWKMMKGKKKAKGNKNRLKEFKCFYIDS